MSMRVAIGQCTSVPSRHPRLIQGGANQTLRNPHYLGLCLQMTRLELER